MSTIKAILKLLLFAIVSIVIVTLQLIVLAFNNGPAAYIIPQQWHRILCFVFGIKIRITGEPYKNGQVIFVSNHISYLDILVLGTALRASFVAKKDIASWPVFGFLSKLQQTAFISRSHIDAKKEKHALDTMLASGKSLIIFPEGTSTDGREVIPFKSSLFAIALRNENNSDIFIQPITLAMQSVDKHDVVTQDDRDLYAWHINMTTPLAEHLWRFAKSRGAEIHLYFHTPVDANEYTDRKILAKTCHEAVSNGLVNHKNKKQ